MRRVLGTLAGAFAIAVTPSVFAQAPAPSAPSVASAAVANPQGAAPSAASGELDALLARVTAESVNPDARKAAANEAMALGSDDATALVKKLGELRRGPTGSIIAVFNLLRDQVSGGINGDSFDLVDALCKFPKTDGPGWKATLQTAVVLRALAHVGETRTIREIVAFVEAHDGAFRVDVARVLKHLGEQAIPALIEAKRGSVEVRKFANRELEGLGKKTAGDMVQVKSAVVLGDVLRAFGTNHDTDALSVVLSFVNSDRALVRQAARSSLALYGQDGKWKLKEAYSQLTGQSAQEGWSSEEIARELFSAYDKVRLQEANQILDSGLAAAAAGKRDEAVADFDRALAMQPLLDRRREMIATYIESAQKWIDTDPDKAKDVYKRALRLDPDPEREAKLSAMVSYLDGKALQRQGIADTEPFRRAVELDPSLLEARTELDRLTDSKESRRDQIRRWAVGGALLLVALAAILLFPRRKLRVA